MKVVLYERFAPSNMHVHVFKSTKMCYVPEWQVVIAREISGSFQEAEPCCSEDPRVLSECKLVADGMLPISGVEIKDVKIADLPEELLRETIVQCRSLRSHYESATLLTKRIFNET